VADGVYVINALDGKIDAAILNVDLVGERSDPTTASFVRRRSHFSIGP
jgi:hypothetical protein